MKLAFNKYELKPKELAALPLSQSFFKKKDAKIRPSIKFYRWFIILALQFFFFASFYFDIQLLEGTLSASRLFGFHLVDIFLGLQSFLSAKTLSSNMLIGLLSVGFFYIVVGGRNFCSFVCPYSLLADIAQNINKKLLAKKLIKEKKLNHNIRFFFFIFFLSLAFFFSNMLFESINIVGILSRFITYGLSLSLFYVLLIFLLDCFYASRAYCTYICPVGTAYSFLGLFALSRVKLDANTCDNCKACIEVCPEEQILIKAKKKNKYKNKPFFYINGSACTMCGACIDVCHQDSLKYDFKLSKLI